MPIERMKPIGPTIPLDVRGMDHLQRTRDQSFVDFHSQAGTLGHIDETIFAYMRRVFEDAETVFIRADWRVMQELPPGCVRPRGNQMQGSNGSDVAASMMR